MWAGTVAHRRTWIIAYDIREPRRLVRVHKLLSRRAFPLQYSVFVADLTERDLARLKARLGDLIDPAVDDVRFYAAPPKAAVSATGGRLPRDVMLFGDGAAGLAAGRARRPQRGSPPNES